MQRNDVIQQHYETIYVIYEKDYQEWVLSIMDRLTKTYATFKSIPFSSNLNKQIHQFYHQIKLTKRKIVFAVIVGLDTPNPELIPLGSKRIYITKNMAMKDNILEQALLTEQQMQVQLIKRFQLDFIWVGVLSRIGTDTQGFQSYLTQKQNFQTSQTSFIKNYYEILDDKLKESQSFDLQLLVQSKKLLQTSSQMQRINISIQQLIRSKFNSRQLIKDITNNNYLNLLTSRSYFNLIFIEAQITKRFQYFKTKIAPFYPHFNSILTFQNFILLDDYIYSQFIFECLPRVKKYINRTFDQESYQNTVKKYHKEIIRQFRPSHDEYFLWICIVLKQRAACLKEAVGAIIVKDRVIISTGYNGTPMGTINCYNGGCEVCNNSQKMGTQVLRCRCIHAEYNCILKAGIKKTPGGVLYSTKLPCLWCAKLIIQGKIKKVICIRSKYSSLQYENAQLVKKSFKDASIVVQQMDIRFLE